MKAVGDADILGQGWSDQRAQRAFRALRTLSECNSALIRAGSEEELLRAVCGSIVQVGGYRMAWVGYAEHDADQTVRPVAQAGHEAGYLETVRVTWADAPRGHGPTGTAVRTGRPHLVRDTSADPAFALWREEATRRGYASIIGLPLVAEGVTLGALTIYAVEPDAFDGYERALLAQLADDLAFGIQAQRTRVRKRQTEEALHESERRFRGIFNQTFEFTALLALDGTVLEANQTALDFGGLTRADVVGWPLWTTRWWSLFPETGAVLREAIGNAASGVFVRYEVDLLGRDDQIITADFSLKPLPGDDGRPLMLIAEGRDVTARKLAGERLRRRNRELTVLHRIGRSLAAALDTHTVYRVVYRAFARRLLHTRDFTVALLDGHSQTLRCAFAVRAGREIDPGTLTPVPAGACPCQAASHAQGVHLVESPHDCPLWRQDAPAAAPVALCVPLTSGNRMLGMLSVQHVRPDAPRAFRHADRRMLATIAGQAAVAIENAQLFDAIRAYAGELEQRVQARTAELAAANERLSDLNHLKDEYLRVVSHDLRSPLGAIQMVAQFLSQDGGSMSAAESSEYLRGIMDSAHYLLEMVNTLLDLQKIETGHLELNVSDLYAEDVLQQSLDMLKYAARAKHIAVNLELPEEAQPVRGDLSKLVQVFNNLISNAIKFTPAGGCITLRVQPAPGGVAIAVQDTGVGIPEKSLQHVFERYYVVRTHGTAGEKGFGLGLTIVKQLVELHGGHVTVESLVGGGSTFTVYLPRDAQRAAVEAPVAVAG